MRGIVEDGDYCVFNKYGSFDNGRIALVQVDSPTDQPDATIKRVYAARETRWSCARRIRNTFRCSTPPKRWC